MTFPNKLTNNNILLMIIQKMKKSPNHLIPTIMIFSIIIIKGFKSSSTRTQSKTINTLLKRTINLEYMKKRNKCI